MFYLENNTTFSGSDIKVYAYRDVRDFLKFKDKEDRKAKTYNQNPLYPNDPFADLDPKDIDLKLSESLEGVASGRAQSTEQKIVVFPDLDKPNSTVDAGQVQEILNQNAPPVFEDLPETYTMTLSNGNVKKNLTADQAVEYALKDSGASGAVLEEPQTRMTYKGETKIIPTEDTFDISAAHVDPQVLDAPVKTDYSAVQTNKVNPNYIDIVKQGSDKNALKFAREYQLAKMNRERNSILDEKGKKTNQNKPIIELGSLYSITYSSFREKNAVRTIGRVSAKDYTRGQRTIAGSMNFTVFQSHELMDFLKPKALEDNIVILDQLPKFNLMLIMINEYGGASILHLFGVTISTESQQTSVEDLALMNNVTFYAEDIMTIENVGNIFETSISMLHPTIIAGRTLQFYKGNTSITLGGLLSIENDVTNNKIQNILSRSRGLF